MDDSLEDDAENQLLHSSRNGEIDAVKQLLDRKKRGEIKLDIDCKGNPEDVIKSFDSVSTLAVNTSLNFLKEENDSLVWLADYSVSLLNILGKNKSNLGWTPLHLSSYFGHKEVVLFLLEVSVPCCY